MGFIQSNYYRGKCHFRNRFKSNCALEKFQKKKKFQKSYIKKIADHTSRLAFFLVQNFCLNEEKKYGKHTLPTTYITTTHHHIAYNLLENYFLSLRIPSAFFVFDLLYFCFFVRI